MKTLFAVVIILMLVNLAYLDFAWFASKPVSTQPLTINPAVLESETGTKSLPTTGVNYDLIWSVIKEATASVTQKVEALSPVQTRTTASMTNTTGNAVKEYYIPLGTGSTSSMTWTAIDGVEAYVVPANFGGISEIYFEASLRVPTGSGRAYARLKNVTDNISLFESEVSREGVEGGLISSGKIPVPTTTKLYRVELKSSLGAEIRLDNARIKIFVP